MAAEFELALQHFLQGNIEQANRKISQILAVHPRHKDALRLREAIESDFSTSEAYFRTEFLKRPQDAGLFLAHANFLHRQHCYAESIAEFRKALALSPHYAAAFHGMGRVYTAIGGTEQAKECFMKAIALRPHYIDARYFLAGLANSADSENAKSEYVTRLFDIAAETFDKRLTEELQYEIPDILRTALDAVTTPAPGSLDILDLGCGTGLSGITMKDLARTLTGVDLSPGMLAKARVRAIYDTLIQGNLVDNMSCRPCAYDLVIAADVFVYVGGLEQVFQAVAVTLRSNGRLLFSVETVPGQSYRLLSSGRYGHSNTYISELAQRYGFTIEVEKPVSVRKEGNTDVQGRIFVLHYPGKEVPPEFAVRCAPATG